MRPTPYLYLLLLSIVSFASTAQTGERKSPQIDNYESWVNQVSAGTEDNTISTSAAAAIANQVPVAVAGSNQTIVLPASSVMLDGSASYDPDGSIVQYYWFQAKGPVSSVIANAFAAKLTATGLTTAGQYIFVLQVKDNNGEPGYAQITVTVSPAGTIIMPSCVTNTSPANGSTLATTTTATLSWPVASQATSYDVYLWKGATVPTTPIINVTTNSYAASGLITNTKYYWYIVPRNTGGTAAGCSGNATSFNTAPDIICTTNISPANGATINTSSKATLSWNEVPGATSYNVYIWPASKQEIGPRANVAGTSYEANVLDGSTTYRWYVAPVFGNTYRGDCVSSSTTFTTAANTAMPDCFVNNTFPANASVLPSQTSVRLKWLAQANAASYSIYLAAGNDKPKTLLAKTTALNYYITNLTPGTLYSWYIIPRNAEDVEAGCYDVNIGSFTTAPSTNGGNIAPVSNAGTNTSITLPTNSVILDGTASYDPDGRITEFFWYQTKGPVTASINNFTATPTVSGLTTAGTYQFGLQAKDNNGVTAYSYVTVVVNQAGTVITPTCVINTSPGNASTITTQTTATLSWQAAPQATLYDVYLWTGSVAPSSPVASVTAANYSASSLTASTLYSWYVVPKNTNGAATGCAANTTTFTTAILPPPCNTIISPANGDTIATSYSGTNSVVLSWTASPTATSYDLHFTTSYTELPLAYATGITSTSFTVTGLYTYGAYLWYVVPKNAGGYAIDCPTRISNFITMPPPVTNCVVNLAPVNGASLAGTSATLSWTEEPNAGNYLIYLWTGPTEPSLPVATTVAGTTTYTITGLIPSTRYNWYVVPRNRNIPTGCGTNTTSFVTGIAVPDCVSNLLPPNASVLPSQTSARLSWPSSPGASSYDVYLAAGNGIPAALVTNTTALNYYATNLTAATQYSWYIAPRNANGANPTCGATNKTSFTTATATSGANLAPVSKAGSNQTIVLPANSVILDGSASYDPDGRIVEYYWFQAKGPVLSSISNVFAMTPTITGLNAAGTYIFLLQVKDNNGVTGYSQLTVTVSTAGTLRQTADANTTTTTATPIVTTQAGYLSKTALPGFAASISPNPAAPGKTVRLRINSDKPGTALINIFNSNGALITTQRITLIAGINTTSIDSRAFSTGLYVLNVTGGLNTVNMKLLVE